MCIRDSYHRNPSFEVVEYSFLLYPAEKVIATIEAKSSAKTKIFVRGGSSIMATTRIMPLHVGKGRTESRAISDIIDYVANPKKTDNGLSLIHIL